MTDCRTQVTFDFHPRKDVVADFDGGLLSSDAGLLPVRQLDHRLGWTAAITDILDDTRQAAKVGHDLPAVIRQRLFGLLAGYEDANDHTRMRHDPVLQTVAADEAKPLASQPTLSRFENAVTARQVARINRLLVKMFIQRMGRRKPKRLILDIDPTDDPCHGHQQLALFNGFYGQYMYLPNLVFERTIGMLLGVRLRQGNADAAHRVVQLLKPIVAALRKKWANMEILIRADAGWMMLWNTPVARHQNYEGMLVWNRYLRREFVLPGDAKPTDLTLNLSYRGGARAFVNGREIARGHLPEGQLDPLAPAEPYALDAYMARPDEQPNSPLPRQVPDLVTSFFEGGRDRQNSAALASFRTPGGRVFLNRHGWERLAEARNRALGPVTIPASALRKGTNVLAVEVRGSLFDPDIFDPHGQEWNKEPHRHWGGGFGLSHGDLLSLELRDPSGTVPSADAEREGLQAWAEDVNRRVTSADYRPAHLAGGEMRIVGALNGTHAGQIVVRADRGINGLQAVASDLKATPAQPGKAVPPTIPAGQISIVGMVPHSLSELAELDRGCRYPDSPRLIQAAVDQAIHSPAVPKRKPAESLDDWRRKVTNAVSFYDHIGTGTPKRDAPRLGDSANLPATIPADTAAALWLSVKIPLSTPPGVYTGSVRLQADGLAATSVPVRVEVLGWRVPNPPELDTDVWLEQHPYAIANHYLLPAGSKVVPGGRNWEGPVKAGVPLWSDEHFRLMENSFRMLARAGNDILHIPIIQRTEFGNYEDSMVRWVRSQDGKITFDFTRLDRYLDLAARHLGTLRVVDFVIMHCQYNVPPAEVTVYDEATGKTETMNVGWNADAMERLGHWKAFATAVIQHMRQRGLEQAVYWGHGGDHEPDPGLMGYLFELFPDTYWSASGHTYHGGAAGGGHSRNIVRCFSDVYGAPKPLASMMGWKGPAIGNWSGLYSHTDVSKFQTYRADESYLYVHNPRDYCRGPGLPILWRTISAHALRRGYSGVGRCGLDGFYGDWMSGFRGRDWGFPGRPCNTLCWPGPDGVESSARFEALLEGVQETEARTFIERAIDRKVLDADLAARCAAVLEEHISPTMLGLTFRDGAADEYLYPWQDLGRKLFETAAEVAQRVGVDVNEGTPRRDESRLGDPVPDLFVRLPALGRMTRSIGLRNWTGQARAWTAEASEPWIVLTRSQGKLLGFEPLAFDLDGATLKPGQKVSGTLTVTDAPTGRKTVFTVSAEVVDPVALTYDHPNFNVRAGRGETREFRIANRAAAPQEWKLAAPVDWLKIAPASGKLAPGAEQIITLTAAPTDTEARVHELELRLTAAAPLVDRGVPSKTFVIPLLREREGRTMPEGKIVKIEEMGPQFAGGVFCGKGTIIEAGAGVAEWGKAHTRKLEKDAELFRTPVISGGTMGEVTPYIVLIGTERFSRGMWVLPHHESVYKLEGTGITAFSAYVGVTRDARERKIRHHQHRVNFEVWVDGQVAIQSGLMSSTDPPRYLVVEGLGSAKEIRLVTRLDSDGDDPTFLATWADAQFYKAK